MGGNVHAPICTDVEPVSESLDLGGGYQGVIVLSPEGKAYVVEMTTGGIVGGTIAEVREDVTSADGGVMAQQIEAAKILAQTAYHVSPSEFWKHLK